MVNINEMQFGFMPGRGTTDAFIARQLQEKYIAAKKPSILLSLTWKKLSTVFQGK